MKESPAVRVKSKRSNPSREEGSRDASQNAYASFHKRRLQKGTLTFSDIPLQNTSEAGGQAFDLLYARRLAIELL